MDKNVHTDDWMKEAPELGRIENSDVFKVPAGYFERFEQQLMLKIEAAEREKNKSFGWRFSRWILALKWPATGAALAACAVIVCIYLFDKPTDKRGAADEYLRSQLAMFSKEEMKSYLVDNVHELDDEILVNVNIEQVSNSEVNEQETAQTGANETEENLPEVNLKNIEDTELEEFIEQGIDMNDIDESIL